MSQFVFFCFSSKLLGWLLGELRMIDESMTSWRGNSLSILSISILVGQNMASTFLWKKKTCLSHDALCNYICLKLSCWLLESHTHTWGFFFLTLYLLQLPCYQLPGVYLSFGSDLQVQTFKRSSFQAQVLASFKASGLQASGLLLSSTFTEHRPSRQRSPSYSELSL